jgi:hypothetical protein
MSQQYSDADGWKMISNKSIIQSWGSMSNFMLSYGLKPHNPEDYDEAHAIIDAMKEGDWSDMTPAEKDKVRAHYLKHNSR